MSNIYWGMATVTGISEKLIGKKGEEYKMVYFKLDNGESAKTFVSPSYGNFMNWKDVLNYGAGIVVAGLQLKRNNLVDADSKPQTVSIPTTYAQA